MHFYGANPGAIIGWDFLSLFFYFPSKKKYDKSLQLLHTLHNQESKFGTGDK